VRAPLYLAGSNILLRLVKQDHMEYPLLRGAVNTLRRTGVELSYTLQNMAGFWGASTRPKERNGFGLTVEDTKRNAQEIERSFIFLPDSEPVYRGWRKIVLQHRVSGVQVHDARLVAAM
jgi:hypothetical protein